VLRARGLKLDDIDEKTQNTPVLVLQLLLVQFRSGAKRYSG
jgi:hypothetical protein